MSIAAEKIQRAYYERTAARYDAMHMGGDQNEHAFALEFVDLLWDRFQFESLLDVGAGTGRAVRFFLSRGRNARGIEPVKALIEQGQAQGVAAGRVIQGSGYHLPFKDNSFDAVFESGALHHVADPSSVVREMMRVARRAVFLSDANRFGQGPHAVRLLKVALYKCHLWNAARFVQTRGKMYQITEGDGLAYSYSVFDSYRQLAQWADTVWLIPTGVDRSVRSWLSPLITAPHLLLCALKTASRASDR